MAETYGVLDWRGLPLLTAATLAQGLPASSRVARARAGQGNQDEKTLLMAVIADRLGHLIWMLSEDGASGKNHPPSLLEALSGAEKEEAGFDTGEDFMAAWTAITGGEDRA